MYMNQTQNEQKRLMNWINIVSFMVDDIQLYLDTHPCDKEALEHFEHYKDLRVQALEEYARCYGPLTVYTTSDYDEWTWVMQPWPWEGGSC